MSYDLIVHLKDDEKILTQLKEDILSSIKNIDRCDTEHVDLTDRIESLLKIAQAIQEYISDV